MAQFYIIQHRATEFLMLKNTYVHQRYNKMTVVANEAVLWYATINCWATESHRKWATLVKC